jgi:hypothetical protein
MANTIPPIQTMMDKRWTVLRAAYNMGESFVKKIERQSVPDDVNPDAPRRHQAQPKRDSCCNTCEF